MKPMTDVSRHYLYTQVRDVHESQSNTFSVTDGLIGAFIFGNQIVGGSLNWIDQYKTAFFYELSWAANKAKCKYGETSAENRTHTLHGRLGQLVNNEDCLIVDSRSSRGPSLFVFRIVTYLVTKYWMSCWDLKSQLRYPSFSVRYEMC